MSRSMNYYDIESDDPKYIEALNICRVLGINMPDCFGECDEPIADEGSVYTAYTSDPNLNQGRIIVVVWTLNRDSLSILADMAHEFIHVKHWQEDGMSRGANGSEVLTNQEEVEADGFAIAYLLSRFVDMTEDKAIKIVTDSVAPNCFPLNYSDTDIELRRNAARKALEKYFS